MPVEDEFSGGEVARLRGCLNDLVAILALPALWAGGEPRRIASTSLDALLEMLRLAFVMVRLNGESGRPGTEMVRSAPGRSGAPPADDIAEVLHAALGDEPMSWPALARVAVGDAIVRVACARLGLHGELGIVVAGCSRPDFPEKSERLLLDVAANQAAIGLQQARLLREQKRVARELDERVAQRTRELATANQELSKEVEDRKRAEDELRRNEAILAQAQRLSSTGSFTWHLQSDGITLSDELRRMCELPAGDTAAVRRLLGLVHPEDVPGLIDKVARIRAEPGPFDHDLRLQMPDGRMKYLRTVGQVVHDQDARLEAIGATQDVTQRRLAEEALDRVRSELAHMTRVMSLGELTASIAHEVNQPLSGILTNAGTCLRMLSADPPNVEGARETARRTIRDANRASDVITRLRALFGRKELTVESTDLNDATREVIALSSSDLQSKRIVVQAELASDLPPVSADRVQLQQVIQNLVRNAAEAMATIHDRPRNLLLRTEREGASRVRVTVRDTGTGIDPRNADKLFNPFYTTKSGGMGIGLSVSRSIVEKHGGQIRVEPNDGPGTTFVFSIPIRGEASGKEAPIARRP